MTDIPMPELIQADSAESAEDGSRPDAQALDRMLGEVTEYARLLWNELEATRRYLMDDVARGGGGPVLAAEPLMRTEEQWSAWVERYAALFGSLCGPHGDQGLGEEEALHEAREHRHLLPARTPRNVAVS